MNQSSIVAQSKNILPGCVGSMMRNIGKILAVPTGRLWQGRWSPGQSNLSQQMTPIKGVAKVGQYYAQFQPKNVKAPSVKSMFIIGTPLIYYDI